MTLPSRSALDLDPDSKNIHYICTLKFNFKYTCTVTHLNSSHFLSSSSEVSHLVVFKKKQGCD